MGHATMSLCIVGLFLAINLALGLWAGRGVKDVRDYAIGNKKWSTGELVMTYLATIIGGGCLFRETREMVESGIIVFICLLSSSTSMIIRGFILSHKIVELKDCITIGDVSEKYYGRGAKILTGFFSILFSGITASLQIKALGIIFSDFLGLDKSTAIVVGGLIVVIYTAFGGIKAVAITDILQFILLFSAIFAMSSFAVSKAGGLEEIFNKLPETFFQIKNTKTIQYYISFAIVNLLFATEMVQPARFQRLLMTETPTKMRRMFIFSGIGKILGITMLFFIAMAFITMVPDGERSQNIVSYILNNVLPDGFRNFAIIGMIAMVLSTGDSLMHSLGLSCTRDFIEPICGKEIKIGNIKYIVMFIGCCCIVLSITADTLFSKMEYKNMFCGPILSAPIFFAMLGFKTSKRMFWNSVFAAISTFTLTKIFLDEISGYATLISTSSSVFVLLLTHYVQNKNWIVNYRVKSTKLIRDVQPKFNLVEFCKKRVESYGAPYVLFGGFYSVVIMLPYLVAKVRMDNFETVVFYVKLISVLICSLLMINSAWPNVLKRYLPLFWYLSITYCLPFLSVILLFLSKGATMYTINVAINIMFLLLLVDWISAIGISLIGIISATVIYKCFLQLDADEIIFGFDTIYLLVYQVIFGSVIGLLFARKKHIRLWALENQIAFVTKFKKSILESNQRSLQIVEDSNKSNFGESLNPRESLKAIKSVLNPQDYEKINQYVKNIETFIEAEEISISPYFVLNVQNIELSVLLNECAKFCKSIGCDDVVISNYSKRQKIQCDPVAMLKVLAKLIGDYLKAIDRSYNDDSYINITIFDTILSYFNDNKEFIRSENAIHIVISGYESVSDELQKSIFKKDLIDPMLIPHTDLEDNEMIDIEHTVDAHYGILEKSEEEGKFSWSCIVPSKVYDIRPITLDLVAPTKRELSYEWPPAEELEVKFLEKINSEKVKINQKKLDHALNVIKIYHRHQTRKSGEPYYMHPISVAMIAIDLIRDNNSKIYEFLQAKEESIILTSLLHDILEDTYYKQKNIINDFGPEILNYIESVTKASYGNRQYLIENQVAFKDLLDREPITVIVKLADRMHNLHTIKGHTKIEKRRLIAQETLDFFVPAAERYSLMKFAQDLKQISDDFLDKNKN